MTQRSANDTWRRQRQRRTHDQQVAAEACPAAPGPIGRSLHIRIIAIAASCLLQARRLPSNFLVLVWCAGSQATERVAMAAVAEPPAKQQKLDKDEARKVSIGPSR